MDGLFDALIGDPVVNKPDQGNTDNANQQNQQEQDGQNRESYSNGVPKGLYGDDFYKRYPRSKQS